MTPRAKKFKKYMMSRGDSRNKANKWAAEFKKAMQLGYKARLNQRCLDCFVNSSMQHISWQCNFACLNGKCPLELKPKEANT